MDPLRGRSQALRLGPLNEIAAVDGVDMLFIGTNDLNADPGLSGQEDHPALDAACASVIEACRRHGKIAGLGGLARRPDLLRRYVGTGARFVSMGTDLALVLAGAHQQAGVASTLADNAARPRPTGG